MPLREWRKPLPDGFWIGYQKETSLGEWVRFAVTLVRDEECIARYDSAHGVAHRDVLGRKSGLLEKTWYENLTFKEVFEHASHDLETNYRAYFDFYAAH